MRLIIWITRQPLNLVKNQILRNIIHVQRRPLEAPVMRVDCMVFSLLKKRGKRARTLEEVVNRDFMVNDIFEDLVFNQVEWFCVIHVAKTSPSGIGPWFIFLQGKNRSYNKYNTRSGPRHKEWYRYQPGSSYIKNKDTTNQPQTIATPLPASQNKRSLPMITISLPKNNANCLEGPCLFFIFLFSYTISIGFCFE